MLFSTYQDLAHVTSNPNLDDKTRLAVAALGLVGESGEVAEHIKKWIGHGHGLDREAVAKELGDVLWYISEIASAMSISLDWIADGNIDKLKQRYPEGFNSQASRERAE